MFSKKHYIKIALALATIKPLPSVPIEVLLMWKDTIGALIGVFAEDSKRFDVTKFWKAVNGKEVEK